MTDEFAAVEPLLTEHAELERKMSDPAVLSDQNQARRVGRRYAELGRVVHAYRVWRAAADDLGAARHTR